MGVVKGFAFALLGVAGSAGLLAACSSGGAHPPALLDPTCDASGCGSPAGPFVGGGDGGTDCDPNYVPPPETSAVIKGRVRELEDPTLDVDSKLVNFTNMVPLREKVYVEVERQGCGYTRVTTARDGTFTLTGVAPRPTSVNVRIVPASDVRLMITIIPFIGGAPTAVLDFPVLTHAAFDGIVASTGTKVKPDATHAQLVVKALQSAPPGVSGALPGVTFLGVPGALLVYDSGGDSTGPIGLGLFLNAPAKPYPGSVVHYEETVTAQHRGADVVAARGAITLNLVALSFGAP